jgi:GNAT superfamily N-acetyltransferase
MSESIGAAKLGDLPQLAILFDSYRQFYGKPSDVVAAHDFLAQRMRNQDSRILVAREDESIAGFTQLYPIFSSVSMRRAWLLNDLYVLQSARGRGVAARLLSAAVAHGRDSGADWLMLQTGQDNQIAQRLYGRSGWQRDDAFLTYNYLL